MSVFNGLVHPGERLVFLILMRDLRGMWGDRYCSASRLRGRDHQIFLNCVFLTITKVIPDAISRTMMIQMSHMSQLKSR